MRHIQRILFAAFALFAYIGGACASVTISGTIMVAEDNEPAIGASVQDMTNGQFGVVADNNGHFSLSVPNASDIIEIRYVGQIPQTFAARDLMSGNTTIYLQPSKTLLNEAVVIGYRPSKTSDTSAQGNGCDDEDNDRIIAELALCSTHAYNIGAVQNPSDAAEKQLIKDAVALKTTVMTQQMNKQYEYLESMMKRFKTQLEKAVLTTKIQAAQGVTGATQ